MQFKCKKSWQQFSLKTFPRKVGIVFYLMKVILKVGFITLDKKRLVQSAAIFLMGKIPATPFARKSPRRRALARAAR